METPNCNPEILKLLAEKSSAKQFAFRQTKNTFGLLKQTLSTIAHELNSNICNIDNHVVVEYTERGDFEAEMKFSGDTLIFQMHTNVFTFEKSHQVWKSSYIKKDELRAFFGVIHIFNFLSDSLKYNRLNDQGTLLGRIFVNKEMHYFVEGKRQLGFLFNDIQHSTISENELRKIIETATLHALDFDITSPDFGGIGPITVAQVRDISNNLKMATGKTLGYRSHTPPKRIGFLRDERE